METLQTYGGSSDEEDNSTETIDHSQTSSVLESIKKKFPLNSAPNVPIRVGYN